MVIKFKNGYSVRIVDTANKSKKEIIAEAKKAVKLLQDAVGHIPKNLEEAKYIDYKNKWEKFRYKDNPSRVQAQISEYLTTNLDERFPFQVHRANLALQTARGRNRYLNSDDAWWEKDRGISPKEFSAMERSFKIATDVAAKQAANTIADHFAEKMWSALLEGKLDNADQTDVDTRKVYNLAEKLLDDYYYSLDDSYRDYWSQDFLNYIESEAVKRFQKMYSTRKLSEEERSAAPAYLKDSKKRKKLDDAELVKNIETNISFKPMKLIEALNKDPYGDAAEREIAFLERDLAKDARMHENYSKTYRKDVLEKLINQYEKALKALHDAGRVSTANGLNRYLDVIKALWGYGGSQKSITEEDGPYIYYRDGQKFDTISTKAEGVVNVNMDQRAGKNSYLVNGLTGEIVYDPQNGIGITDSKFVTDSFGKKFIVLIKAFGKLLYLSANGFTSHEEEAERFNFEKDAYEAAKAVTQNAPNSYHIIAINEGDDEESFKDSKKIKDVPYYDPTDYPAIKSDYSTERLSKELRHPSASEDLDDLQGMITEMEEFISQGTQALIDAGWTKDDARHAIAARYYPMVKELRKAGKKDLAKQLLQQIHKLEKAWDLIR